VKDPYEYLKLRPVETRPSRTHPGACDVTDPSGIAAGVLTLSGALLFIASLLDGRRRRADVQAEFMRCHGSFLFSDDLDRIVRQLDDALFLDTPAFDARWAELTRQYRAASFRPIRDQTSLGAPFDRMAAYLDAMLAHAPAVAQPPPAVAHASRVSSHRRDGGATAGRLLGLVAPHLDYARGGPCYAAAYRGLADRADAVRFVILGTNHFGRSASVVGTRRDFETPFGIVPHDADFMRRLDRRLGADLCEYEYDHAREHSIELQAIVLHHVLGPRPFAIAPYLCPDPCGPTGTAPRDGRGVDLADFVRALRAELDADRGSTCLIAAADLSHVGRFFNDERGLDPDTLHDLERADRAVLDHLLKGSPADLRRHVSGTANDTNICSVGCLYALAAALDGLAEPRLLHYHQAVIPEAENCVTCAALEFR
jgi:hypothetical protein